MVLDLLLSGCNRFFARESVRVPKFVSLAGEAQPDVSLFTFVGFRQASWGSALALVRLFRNNLLELIILPTGEAYAWRSC
jgi:hypothetical protein